MRSNEAYSLFEVLVAFAIATSVLTVLLPAQSVTLRRGTSEIDLSLAQDYAYSILAEVSVVDDLGTLRQPPNENPWRATLTSELIAQENGSDIFRILVEVHRVSGEFVASAEGIFAR